MPVRPDLCGELGSHCTHHQKKRTARLPAAAIDTWLRHLYKIYTQAKSDVQQFHHKNMQLLPHRANVSFRSRRSNQICTEETLLLSPKNTRTVIKYNIYNII